MDRRVVFTNGCFDVFHYGHLHILREASTLGDCLVVGINSDDSVRRLKGNNRPIFPLLYRKQILQSLRFVDSVIPFEEDTPLNLIKHISPDVLVKGSDYSSHDIVGADFVKSYGGDVKTVPLIKGISSTNILECLYQKRSLNHERQKD